MVGLGRQTASFRKKIYNFKKFPYYPFGVGVEGPGVGVDLMILYDFITNFIFFFHFFLIFHCR